MDENRVIEEGSKSLISKGILIIKKYLWLLIVCVILSTVCGGVLGKCFAKTYHTESCRVMLRVYIDYGKESVAANTSLAKEYLFSVANIIESPKVAEYAKTLHGDEGIKRSNVSVSYSTESLIFTIKYTDLSKQAAESRLSDIIDSANIILPNDKLIGVNDVELIEMQNSYSYSTSSRMKRFILLGFGAGVVIGVIFVVLLNLFDNKVKDREDIERLTQTSLLSTIDK